MDSIQSQTPLASTYQLDKWIKHTKPTKVYDVNSIFASPSTGMYKGWFVSSSVSGSMEEDDLGRTNFIWFAGQQTGATYDKGVFSFPTDAVKLVLPHDADKIHAFPVSSTGYAADTCASCGRHILG